MKKFTALQFKSKTEEKRWDTTTYNTLGEFLRFLEKNEKIETNQYSSHKEDSSFSGTKDFEEALGLLKHGSPEIMNGLKKAVKLSIAKLAKELNTLPQGYVADVVGLFFDVSKVIDGEPEAWLREPWDKEKKPRIKVPISGSYTAGVSKDLVIQNASEIIALIKALEDNGFEVEAIMVFPANDVSSGRNACSSVIIKGFDESFNWSKLSGMLHPSFFRRLMFRDLELMYPETLRGGYGGTTPDTYTVFEGGESMLKLDTHSSIEKFKEQVLYRLRGNK